MKLVDKRVEWVGSEKRQEIGMSRTKTEIARSTKKTENRQRPQKTDYQGGGQLPGLLLPEIWARNCWNYQAQKRTQKRFVTSVAAGT